MTNPLTEHDVESIIIGITDAVLGHFRREMVTFQNRLDAFEKTVPTLVIGPQGEDGKDGKDIDPEFVKAEIARAVAEIPRPRDGKDVSLQDVEPLIKSAVSEAVAALPPAQAPVGVTDSLINQDGHLVMTFSDGRTKEVGRVKAAEVDPAHVAKVIETEIAKWPRPKDGIDGIDGRDGVGHDDVQEELEDGGRFVVRKYLKDGVVVREFRHKTTQMVYRGIYEAGRVYDIGDVVTWGGSDYIAVKDGASAKPGEANAASRAWQMHVKRGGDGKPGPAGPPGPPGPVGPQGPQGKAGY